MRFLFLKGSGVFEVLLCTLLYFIFGSKQHMATSLSHLVLQPLFLTPPNNAVSVLYHSQAELLTHLEAFDAAKVSYRRGLSFLCHRMRCRAPTPPFRGSSTLSRYSLRIPPVMSRGPSSKGKRVVVHKNSRFRMIDSSKMRHKKKRCRAVKNGG